MSDTLVCTNCQTSNPQAESSAPVCTNCQKPLPWLIHSTDDSFNADVSTDIPVLIDFWAPWCPPCVALTPILDDLAKDFAGRFKIIKVNIDENPKLSAYFGIQSIPALAFIKESKVVDMTLGLLPKQVLKERMEHVINLEIVEEETTEGSEEK